MIAALYARKSSDDERSAEDGKSIDRQVELARAFAVKQGWAVSESFVDDGISGANFQRDGLLRLLADARKKTFSAVVMMSLDRLGREQVDLSKTLQTLTRAGVQVWTYQDGQQVKFHKSVDKLVVGIGGFAAENYREAVKEKVVEALRAKAKRGHSVNGRTYGYSRVRVGDHTEKVIEPEQAAMVRRIFEMSASGLGDDRIAAALHQDGAPAPGKAWTKRPVRTILGNEIYIGRAVYGMTANVDDGGAGKRVRVDRAEWITTEQPALRIVSDELWARVQGRKAQTRSHYLRTITGTLLSKPESGLIAKHMLSGIARCAECGSTMTFVGDRSKKRY
jgi:DNA invertase Pin-like site-specific DNA recombinase